jgi:hypothetical protein
MVIDRDESKTLATSGLSTTTTVCGPSFDAKRSVFFVLFPFSLRVVGIAVPAASTISPRLGTIRGDFAGIPGHQRIVVNA